MTEEEINQNTLARVDERTKSIQNDISQLRDEIKTTALVLAQSSRDMEARFDVKIKEHERQLLEVYNVLDIQYVKKVEFSPIKIVVYGFIGLLLTALVTGIIATTLHLPTKQYTSIEEPVVVPRPVK